MSIKLLSLSSIQQEKEEYQSYLDQQDQPTELPQEEMPSIGPVRKTGLLEPTLIPSARELKRSLKPGFFELGLSRFLKKLDHYVEERKFSKYTLETKLKWLNPLAKATQSFIKKLTKLPGQLVSWQQKRLIALRELLNHMRTEYRFLLGIPKDTKVYLPMDEVEVEEDFARGNSASVAKIKYNNHFEAVFKSASNEETVPSMAADKFWVNWKSQELRFG